MRLLDTNTFQFLAPEHEHVKRQGYAILSHRWKGKEITFQQMQDYGLMHGDPDDNTSSAIQWIKIRGACLTARSLGLKWIWIDSCCINKASDAETTESINSMFKWYRDATVCITYLDDVRTNSPLPLPKHEDFDPKDAVSPYLGVLGRQDGTPSKWFSRGWTLQEQLAPKTMYFYDQDWTYIGTKTSLAREIQAITRVEAAYLTGAVSFRLACIAVKMSWMKGRTTTRPEDMAYSMIGLFNNINMTPQYGEGHNAFMRLQQLLLERITDESLFAWRMPNPTAGRQFGALPSEGIAWADDEWGMLAPSPEWFSECENVFIEGGQKIERASQTFQLLRSGVQIPITPISGDLGHQALWVAAQVAFVGALIPVYYWLRHHQKKQVMKGMEQALNCWMLDENKNTAALTICLQPTDKEHLDLKNIKLAKCKRIRASERILKHDYPRKDVAVGEGVVLQPELTYGY